MKGMPNLNQQIRLTKIPSSDYPLKETNIFQIKFTGPIPTDRIKDGEVVIKNKFVSIDAAMRTWINGLPSYVEPVKPGDVMKALTVGEVVFSKSDKFKTGDLAMGHLGWESYSVAKAQVLTKLPKNTKSP